MPTAKPATTSRKAPSTRRFSLVSAAAQLEMYRALATLKPSRSTATGSEVAEIALCLAAGEQNPVILACSAAGARSVRGDCKIVRARERRLTAATLAAIEALLHNDQATTAIVCAGKLDTTLKTKLETTEEARQDCLAAFRFAARHKLGILFLVANSLASGQPHPLDLGNLCAGFGIPCFSVDAADAIAAYRVATEALHNARHLRGPCVIEALTLHSPDAAAHRPLDLLASYMERHGNPPPRL